MNRPASAQRMRWRERVVGQNEWLPTQLQAARAVKTGKDRYVQIRDFFLGLLPLAKQVCSEVVWSSRRAESGLSRKGRCAAAPTTATAAGLTLILMSRNIEQPLGPDSWDSKN